MKLSLVILSLLTVTALMSCGRQPGAIEQKTPTDYFVASENISNTDSVIDEVSDIPNNTDGNPSEIPPSTDLPPVTDNTPDEEIPPVTDNTPDEEIPPVVDQPSVPPKKGKGPKASDVVECQLGAPNAKVTLSAALEKGSNKKETRVCMSKNACLNLVNAYANVRSCSLQKGGATTPGLANDQCTEVFPGSSGTCKQAKILSDADVSSILSEMAK